MVVWCFSGLLYVSMAVGISMDWMVKGVSVDCVVKGVSVNLVVWYAGLSCSL